MPIRINLKEVFTADSQDLVINKVNFNFNKLLELGIGEDGPIGLTGPQGPAGPTGLPGDPGTPGNIWYVGTTADPNNDTFPDVNTGDFYLDTELFTIWRYNGTIWLQQTDITTIINDYLSTTASVLTRGFGNGTVDDKFIVFNNRGQTETRRLTDSNDILFLNNFSETYLNSIFPAFTLNSSAFFNSLLSISVDRSNSAAPYRQHIELGVLYGDGSGTPEGHTSTNESLKIKYERVDSPVLGNDYYNIATLSLDLPETVSVGRTTNGVFNFVSPKMYTGVDTNSNVYIGSRYGLDEVYGTSGTMKADGLLFHKSGDALYANIGIAQDFLIPNYPAATGYVTNLATNGYFMIDSVNTTLTGVYLNDPLYLTGGNLIQLGNTTPREVAATTVSNSPRAYSYGMGGLTAIGNTLFFITGQAGFDPGSYANPLLYGEGWFNRFNIEDPNTPISTMSLTYNGQTNGNTRLVAAAASDIAASGKYIYVVNNQNIINTPTPGLDKRTYFQILAPNSIDSDYTRLSRLGEDSRLGSSTVAGTDPEELNGAYRVKIKGGYALVATNALRSYGSNYHGVNFLGQGETTIAGSLYDGYLTSIDITNPEIPRIKNRATNTKETISDWVANNGSATYIQRSAILDFDIAGEYAYALAWEQTVSATAATAKVCVKIIAFDISNPDSITYHGKSDSASNGTFINAYYNSSISLLSKNGAIVANDQYVYAAYGNQIKVFRTNDKTGSYIFPVASTYTISDLTSTQFITDIKKVGNSLYVVALLSYSSAPFSKVYKFNINDSTLTKVWEKSISGTAIASQLVVIGKHVYCSVHDYSATSFNKPTLITLDYDGIYTSGAHIEALRSDTASVTQDLTVGGHAQLDSSLTVGGPVGIHGQLEVGSNARINGELRVTNYGSDTSSIEVGFNRTASGYAYIDLIGDTTYDDYGVRLIRNATGPNTTSELVHNGTGNLEIITNHAAAITFKTNGSANTRATIDDTGINLIDGTAVLPAYSFISDPDTGMYLIGAGTIGFATDGVLRARIGERGIKVIDGTAANPSYSFFNDVDSGIYLVSDGIIGFSVNFYQRAQLDSYGIKLIDGTAGAPSYSFISDDNSGMYSMGAGQIGFTIDGNTARVKIDVGGINLINGTAASPSYSFINDENTGLYLIGSDNLGVAVGGFFIAGVDGYGVKLINGSAVNPSYSFYNDPDSGLYLISDGNVGFAVNGLYKASIDTVGIKLVDGLVTDPSYSFYSDTGTGFYRIGAGTIGIATSDTLTAKFDTNGIKLENGSASFPSYAFINDTDTGLYLNSTGTLGFTTNGTQRAYLNSDGLHITVNGGSLALRGTDHSYIRFYGRGNLANPGVISEQSAYIGFPDASTDLFYIFNQRLNTIITLEETGKFSLRNETAQSIPYTSLQIITNRATGLTWNGSSAPAGVTLDASIFAGGNVYIYDGSSSYYLSEYYVYDDRNLSVRHDKPGYINLLNTPAYSTSSLGVPNGTTPTPSWTGWAPTHPGVHTRFASQDGSTEYANININGLTIANRIDFSDSNDVLGSTGGPAWIHFNNTDDYGRLEFSCKGRNNLMLYNAGGPNDSPRLMLRDDGATATLTLGQDYNGGNPLHTISANTPLYMGDTTLGDKNETIWFNRPINATCKLSDGAGTKINDNKIHLLTNGNEFNFDYKGDNSTGIYYNDDNGSGGVYTNAIHGFLNGNGVYATAYAAAFTVPSDIRLKENIQNLPAVIDDILKLRVVTYNFINDPELKNNIGVIAQEVKEIFPTVVDIIDDTKRGFPDSHVLDYSRFSPILIKGLQEVIIENTELKAKNQELEARLAAIEAKLGL